MGLRRRVPLKGALLLLPLFALIALLGWLTASTNALRVRNGHWVTHTLQAVANIERTRASVSAVRFRERNVVLGIGSDARPLYAQAVDELGETLETLWNSTEDDPFQRKAIQDFQAAWNPYLVESRRIVTLPPKTEAAFEATSARDHCERFDRAMRALSLMREQEQRLLALRQDRLNTNVAANGRNTKLTFLAMGLSLIALAILMQREDRARREADEASAREREVAERAKVRSENLAEAAFEGLAVSQDGVIVDANTAFLRLFGYDSVEAVRGMRAELFAALESRSLVLQRRSAHDEEPYEAVLLRRDGTTFLGELRGRRTEIDGRIGRVTAIRDLTRQRNAERAVRESEARLSEAQALASFGSWSLETATGRLTWSDELFRLFAMDASDEPILEEVLGRYHADDVARLTEFYERCAREGTPYDVTVRLRQYGNAYRWVRCIGQAERDGSGEVVRVFGVMSDVHALKSLEEEVRQRADALRQSEAALRALLRAAPVVLFAADSNGIITLSKGAGLSALGLQPGEAVGRSVFDLDPDAESRASIRLALDGDVVNFETWHGDVCLHKEIRPLTDEHGDSIGIIGVAVDVTARKLDERKIAAHAELLSEQRDALEAANQALGDNQALLDERLAEVAEMNIELEAQRYQLKITNERLEALATIDGLTGLKNQRFFRERLEEECAEAWRLRRDLSLLVFDVDRFKQYNDAFGHPAGDEALRAVAEVLKAEAREYDIAARNGGEEFALLLPGTDVAGAALVAERVRVVVEARAWTLRQVTVSIGVATLLPSYETSKELVAAADRALYDAKEGGRNRAVVAQLPVPEPSVAEADAAIGYPLLENEDARLAALLESGVYRSNSDEAFDTIAEATALLMDTPIAMVTLVGADEQWFMASVGIDAVCSRRDSSFCTHAMLETRPMIVPDATLDPRFADNPFVTGEVGLRFYIGAPVLSGEGLPLGTLCAIDRVPRTPTEEQVRMLERFARQVAGLIESKRQIVRLTQSNAIA